ncbi:MAG TPA: hydantoinase/oxoprolinase family protein, partial [Actinomycetota bacterium]|nr:hydantoinase/oxoprolinase family protein [Actinomycetota bacterium]
IVPPSAGVASAFGMLTAAAGFEYARSLAAPLGETHWPTVRTLIDELVREGRRHLEEGGAGSDGGHVRVEVAADVRHRGQGESVTVELGSALARDPEGQIEAAFEDAYVRLYGRRPPGVEAEVMTWRVRVRGPAPELSVPPSPASGGSARKGWRDVWFAEAGRIRTEVWNRYRLGPGQPITGPAVIEERESTTVVGPGGSGVVDGSGALVVQLP